MKLPGPDNPDTWEQVAVNLESGKDLVPSLVLAVFKTWPEDDPSNRRWSDLYNHEAPEVELLDAFREAIGTRILGSFREDIPQGWANHHSREEAVTLVRLLRDKNQ